MQRSRIPKQEKARQAARTRRTPRGRPQLARLRQQLRRRTRPSHRPICKCGATRPVVCSAWWQTARRLTQLPRPFASEAQQNSACARTRSFRLDSKGSATLKNARTVNAGGVGLMYDSNTGKPKFRLYTYEQQRDGVPVFRAGLRTLVREDADNPVVWANSDLRPMGKLQGSGGPARASYRSRQIVAGSARQQRCFGTTPAERAEQTQQRRTHENLCAGSKGKPPRLAWPCHTPRKMPTAPANGRS